VFKSIDSLIYSLVHLLPAKAHQHATEITPIIFKPPQIKKHMLIRNQQIRQHHIN